ncbi:unnamed protein product [Urochloa decumbens]|uniref:DUF6598 domain-containing protein n=1 Tax=Urochloa decumbens TaxID=240449 RepID=A0ABC9GBH9_9POAL
MSIADAGAMDVDVDGDELAVADIPGRGKKRSLESPPADDGEDSATSTTSDYDYWKVSDSGEDDDHGTPQPFTVNDFPRLSSDHFEQTTTLYRYPGIYLRGPSPLSLFCAFKDYPAQFPKGSHWFGRQYRLYDESEISVNNDEIIDCSKHCHCQPTDLLQLIDLKISGYLHTQPGPAKIFGFFAARDKIQPLRNYVYRRGMDNYEAVSVKRKMGMARLSLTGPARGICITSHALLEFELCVRAEDPPEDEAKGDILIKGCTEIDNVYETKSFVRTGRLYGEKCGLDVKFAVLVNAVQATVDVEILRAPVCGLDLKLYAKTSGFSDVIRLFEGVAEAGRRLSSVVAVVWRSHLDLCIRGSSVDNGLSQNLPYQEWKCRFDDAGYHGTVSEKVDLFDSVTILAKVTWKAVETRGD